MCASVHYCVCVSVQSVQTRLQPPRIGVMALLEQEVYHIEDSSAYAALPSSSNIDSIAHTDLLLGTQVMLALCCGVFVRVSST